MAFVFVHENSRSKRTPPAFNPDDYTVIHDRIAMSSTDGTTFYLIGEDPLFSHEDGDKVSQRMIIGKLHVENQVPQKKLAEVFRVHRNTVSAAVKKYRENGFAAFFKNRKPRKRTAVTPESAKRGRRMLAEGMSRCAAARALGIDSSTFHRNCKAGVIAVPADASDKGTEPVADNKPENSTDPSSRNSKDKQASMGRATHNVNGRQLAVNGQIDGMKPEFETGHQAVENGGVLTALPILLKEGLLSEIGKLPKLPKGFHGLPTLLLFLAFLTLARIRNPELMRYQAPGDWGVLLGFDRCPEVKTLRRKTSDVSQDKQSVRKWQFALFQRWMNQQEEATATFLIDGHAKVYTGRKGKLPKHYVSRQKLCSPASVGYWINALGGRPLMCLHQDLDPHMVKMIEDEIVPELKRSGKIGDPAPDLTRIDSGEPSVTLVFDREGWSPSMFKNLAREGIAVITWRKNNKQEDWPREHFKEMVVPMYGPAETTERKVMLAEKTLVLPNDLKVREIRRLLDDGKQSSLMTTHPVLSMQEVAGSMFSRWSQENFFKYMREEFNLDALPSHDLELVDVEAEVVNPVHRNLNKELKKTVNRINSLRNRLSRITKKIKTRERDEAELVRTESRMHELKDQLKATPTHVKVGELSEPLHALPTGRRMIYDMIRMISFRTETKMMGPIIPSQGKKRNARGLLKALFTTKANVIPDSQEKVLRVQIFGLGSDCLDQALKGLLTELNAEGAIYPGTELRMVYELA